MKKILILLTITALIVPVLARDYQSEYEAIATTEAAQTFFAEIDQADLVDAVAEICSERDMEHVNMVFRTGIGDNMNIPLVQNQLIQIVTDPYYEDSFRWVTLSELDDANFDAASRESFTNALIETATDQSENVYLRGKAISVSGSFDEQSITNMLINLLDENNDIVRNNCGRAIRKNIYFYTDSEKSQIVQRIANITSTDITSLLRMKALITVLGHFQNTESEQVLLSLLNQVGDEEQLSPVVYSLRKYPTIDNAVVILGRYDELLNSPTLTDKTGLELIFYGYIKENQSLVFSLSQESTPPAKLAYLDALVLTRSNDEAQVSTVTTMLGDSDPTIRLKAVHALHFLLSHADEEIVFGTHRAGETDQDVLYWIGRYIGA